MNEGAEVQELPQTTSARGLDAGGSSAQSLQRLLADPRLLEQLSDIVCILDRRLQFVYVSRTLEGRRSVAEVVGTNALDYVPYAHHESFRTACERVWSSGTPETIECPATDHWWETRIVPIHDDGGTPLLLLTSALITERKRREQELSERERQLRHAIEASGVGTWTWNRARDEVFWDDGLCRIYGVEGQAEPRSYGEYLRFTHPEDRERIEAQIAKALETGVYEDFEHRLIRPDGEVRHVFCRGVTVVDERGVVIGMRGGIFDITDRKRLEEQLRHVQKMEAIGQLTAGIAHNFNNLLSIVLPNVELCRAQAPAAVHGLLADIEHAAVRATELVRQLMRFARHEIGADKRDVDLVAIVQRTVSICRATFDRRISIELIVEPELPAVLARAGEIEQVLLNICINARDALRDAHSDNPRIVVEVRRGGQDMLRVSVRDNGPGMDGPTRARLFEPFFTTKEVGQGTGLGLASAYGIVFDHQGQISCESAVGSGTVFTIELPIARETRNSAPGPVPTPASRGCETILFVDDEPLVRRALGAVLAQSGFRVIEAEDGCEGLALLDRRDTEIDLVLLDRSMPRMCGEQFLQELPARGAKVPIVLLTGYPGADAELEGVQAVLSKPPKTDELLRTIRELLDGASS